MSCPDLRKREATSLQINPPHPPEAHKNIGCHRLSSCAEASSSSSICWDWLFCQDVSHKRQGFPILNNGTVTSEDQLDGLLKLGIEVASLSGHIANAQAIHQA